MRPKLAVLLLVLFVALSACGPSGVPGPCRADHRPPDFARLAEQLRAAHALWQAAGSRDYRYDFSQTYTLPQSQVPHKLPTLRITVRGGVFVSSEALDGPAGPTMPPLQPTIEEQFTLISQYITWASGIECGELAVSYDATDGHPTSSAAPQPGPSRTARSPGRSPT